MCGSLCLFLLCLGLIASMGMWGICFYLYSTACKVWVFVSSTLSSKKVWDFEAVWREGHTVGLAVKRGVGTEQTVMAEGQQIERGWWTVGWENCWHTRWGLCGCPWPSTPWQRLQHSRVLTKWPSAHQKISMKNWVLWKRKRKYHTLDSGASKICSPSLCSSAHIFLPSLRGFCYKVPHNRLVSFLFLVPVLPQDLRHGFCSTSVSLAAIPSYMCSHFPQVK